MNKLFKSLVLIASFALVSISQAATVFYNPTSTNIASVTAGQGVLSTVTFANNSGSAISINLFDSPTNAATWVASAYTNRVNTTGTTVFSETNFYGRITSVTNNTVTTTLSVQGAATNNYRVLYSYTVPASTSHTLTFDPKIYFLNGIAATTSATNVIVTLNYTP